MSRLSFSSLKSQIDDALWVLGFLSAFFLFSTIVSFVFFHREELQLLRGMGVAAVLLAGGEYIKRWLR